MIKQILDCVCVLVAVLLGIAGATLAVASIIKGVVELTTMVPLPYLLLVSVTLAAFSRGLYVMFQGNL